MQHTSEQVGNPTLWLTTTEAAAYANCGVKTIYREVSTKRLRAVRVRGRKALRFRPEWLDEWLMQDVTIS